jgi:hypothetical protein
MEGEVTISDHVLYFRGRPLETRLTQRILAFMEADQEGLARPLINFLAKVMENPSRRAVLGLYDWVERSGLPITPEGDVIAYKIVMDDYRDIYSKTFDNTPGKVVSVPRYEVDENPDQTCSYGLHVCSPGYLPHYGTQTGNKVVVVRVHPKDFVAVPRDYNCAKARVAEYEVIGEMPREIAAEYMHGKMVFDPAEAAAEEDVEGVVSDIEEGETYRTRDGRTVTIDEIVEDDEPYPVKGQLDGESTSWTLDGLYYEDEQHSFDLVELIIEQPKPKPSWISRILFGDR